MGIWLELDVESKGDVLGVTLRGSRGERPPAVSIEPERGLEVLQSLGNKVARSVRAGRPLDPPTIEMAQSLYDVILQGEIRDVVARAVEASGKDGRIVLRLFLKEPSLAALPWEVICKPGTTEGHWSTEPRMVVARGVYSSDPWEPREVRGAVRVLAIAPGSDERALAVLREALAPSVEAGEVEWLDPIAGADISAKVLYERLRRGKTPHIVHFVGHGSVDMSGRPVLRLSDDEDGEEVWIPAESLARELSASFIEECRLVILEACEGAKPGALGSAAEIFAKAGADAVVAHLWPVRADVARLCSSDLYINLTAADRSLGDVGQALSAARRTMLAQSAEAFSPVLYLRGNDTSIFRFEGRRVAKPAGKRKTKNLAPALLSVLEKRDFAIVLGDLDEDRAALRQELSAFMEENGDKPAEGMSLSAITQRCLLRFGQEVLHSLFQQALSSTLQSPPPPLVSSLARFAPPGVHVTLLWRPHLERAIAERQPSMNIYAIQPAIATSGGKPRVVKRAAGSTVWKMEPVLPKRFDVENDIVVLRLYGGYSAEARPIFSQPVLTEDDHLHGLVGIDGWKAPTWMEELLARPRIEPGMFVGLSVLDWRHRSLLRWLYDHRPAPQGSLVLLPPGVDATEPEIWDGGAGLPGAGRIAPIVEEADSLASMLDELEMG